MLLGYMQFVSRDEHIFKIEVVFWKSVCGYRFATISGTNHFYLVDKLCPALRNHCLLGHSPRLFLQPAGDNQLNPRQSEDHIHCLDRKKTLNCWSFLWPQLNPTNSPHFQSVCSSENPAIPLQSNLHGSFGIGFLCTTLLFRNQVNATPANDERQLDMLRLLFGWATIWGSCRGDGYAGSTLRAVLAECGSEASVVFVQEIGLLCMVIQSLEL